MSSNVIVVVLFKLASLSASFSTKVKHKREYLLPGIGISIPNVEFSLFSYGQLADAERRRTKRARIAVNKIAYLLYTRIIAWSTMLSVVCVMLYRKYLLQHPTACSITYQHYHNNVIICEKASSGTSSDYEVLDRVYPIDNV
ncbi:hypothetical protein T10_8749 [Trichinella papuae]|uniref:Uncharacterized protein n=1 Tax=Trichinella papuae TaxID=268474 RepID=A0A0V1MRE9_9BILA|nr:hypothetical protein T10_8749 [Trichinella papuae]